MRNMKAIVVFYFTLQESFLEHKAYKNLVLSATVSQP